MIQAVLDNPYLTEAVLLPVLNRPDCPPKIVESIAGHPKWGLRYDVRLGLLRHSSLPLARALAILPGLKPQDAKAISQDPAVIPQVRNYLESAERLLERHLASTAGSRVPSIVRLGLVMPRLTPRERCCDEAHRVILTGQAFEGLVLLYFFVGGNLPGDALGKP
jgi:hypothetical protein